MTYQAHHAHLGPSPIELDERSRRDGATIHTVRDLIPKECFVIDPWRAWGAVGIALIRLAIGLLALSLIEVTSGVALLWQIPLLLAAWLYTGWCFTGLFVIGHDCAHMAFSEKKWVNELVGHLCLSPEFTGFHNWRIWHNYHHAKTQLRGVDPDWAEKMMTHGEFEQSPIGVKAHVRLGFGTPLGMLVGFWVGMFRRTFMKATAPQIPLGRDAPRQLLFSSVVMFASCVAVSAALVHMGGVWALVKYYLVPTFIAAAHGAMLTYLHHTNAEALVFDREGWTPLRGQVISTFNVRFPTWVEAMWFDINIHLPHHLAPKIPWYHLKTATEAIRKANPDWVQERQFSLSYLRSCWAHSLITPASSGERYEMTTFEAAESAVPVVSAARE